MAVCASCGEAVAPGARFCAACGAAVVAHEPGGSLPRAEVHESRRVVSILFADVVGSTELAEALDAEAVRRHMARWFTTARESIERHGGTVEKFIGDAVMAVFGVPVIHEDDPLRAARAAIELRDADHGPLTIRIGLTTGEVVAGDPGTGQTFVTGDPVNTAARLQAAAAPGSVVIDDATWRRVRDTASATPLAPLDLKGKREPVTAHRLDAVAPEGPAIARRLEGPMVGRAEELAALREALAVVQRSSSTRVVTVVGQAGIGKSRLVHEFLRGARSSSDGAAPATILRSRCLPYGEGITYLPVADLIREAVGASRDEPTGEVLARVRALAADLDQGVTIAPHLEGLMGLRAEIGAAADVAWAVRRTFEGLASRQTLIVVVDDIQWAEGVLIDLLGHIVDRAQTAPILLVCMARPEVEDAPPAWFDHPRAATIRLAPLSTDEGSTLVDELLGGLPLDATDRERIAVAADGNPLFIEQLLAMLTDDGILSRDDGRWVARSDLGSVSIPPSISALLAARIDRVPAGARRTLVQAAVIGKVFTPAEVADLAAADATSGDSDVSAHLADLVGRELLVADGRRNDAEEPTYRFRHLLVRDAAYSALSKAERAALHARHADWLEASGDTDQADRDLVAAYHLEQAYRFRTELGEGGEDVRTLADRARRILGPAGRSASVRGDGRAATSLLRRAVDLSPQGRDRAELLLDLGAALWSMGEIDASDAADAEADALLAEYPDEGLAYRRKLAQTWQAVNAGGSASYEDIIATARDAYAIYERIGDRIGMMRALDSAGGAHAMSGEPSAEVELLGRAMALAREADMPDRAAGYAGVLANRLPVGLTTVPDALETCQRYLEISEGNGEAQATILLSVGFLEAMSESGHDWRQPFEQAKAIADELGLMLPLGTADHPMLLAWAELEAGDPSRVVGILRWSFDELERLKDYAHLASIAPLLAEALMAIGSFDDVAGVIARGRDVAAHDDLDAQVRWRAMAALLRSHEGRHDGAKILADEAVERVAPTEFIVLHCDALMWSAHVLRAAGDEVEACAAAERALRLARQKQNRAGIRRIEAFLAAGGPHGKRCHPLCPG